MRKAVLLLSLALASCAPTQRYAMKRCPTVYASLVDFTISATALALSALAYNAQQYGRAAANAGVGMGVALAANVAECRR